MLITTELRWFASGPLPDPILTWFQQDLQPSSRSEPETRTDYYLYIPGCEFLNVKFRQNKLEVKWRQAQLQRLISLPEQLSGSPERWIKWSCQELQAHPALPEAIITTTQGWIAVQKTRSQCLYVIQPSLSLPNQTKYSESQRCQVELTQLEVRDQLWWSLAFETNGNDLDQQIQTLQMVTDLVLKPFPTDLEETEQLSQRAWGYPRWLLAVTQHS